MKSNTRKSLLLLPDNTDDEDDNDELVAFSDADYEDDDTGG